MSMAKIAVTLDEALLKRVDRLVHEAVFPNRSRAIREAVAEKLARLEHGRLARECAKLDRREEQALADAGMASLVLRSARASQRSAASQSSKGSLLRRVAEAAEWPEY